MKTWKSLPPVTIRKTVLSVSLLGQKIIPKARWSAYDYEELINRDKSSLDIFWLKDDRLEDSGNLSEPDAIGLEIIEDLKAALEQFNLIIEDIGLEEVK